MGALRVLVPRRVPWPLLTILGYGAVIGAVSVVVEVHRRVGVGRADFP
ncbi:hypothetical protein SANTM175S_01763 [Streptomyces antimycoticus]